jgi:hypothetical protein
MSKLIEVNHGILLVPSAISKFEIKQDGDSFLVLAYLIGQPNPHTISSCATEEKARNTINRVWGEAQKRTGAVTIKAILEEE